MIELKPGQMIDGWCGATVYDVETGYLCGNNYALDKGGKLFEIVDERIHRIDGVEMREVAEVSKEGKFFVLFDNGTYTRW